jgi:hypothetical protein
MWNPVSRRRNLWDGGTRQIYGGEVWTHGHDLDEGRVTIETWYEHLVTRDGVKFGEGPIGSLVWLDGVLVRDEALAHYLANPEPPPPPPWSS